MYGVIQVYATIVEYTEMLTYAHRCIYLPFIYVNIYVYGVCVNKGMLMST